MPPLRTKRPYAKAFLCAIIVFLVGLPALYIGMGEPQSADSAVEAAGRLALTIIPPALLTGFLARRANRPWSMGKIASMFLVAFLIVGVLSATAISMAGAGP